MKTVFICLVLLVVLLHQSEGCKKPCQKRVHRHHIWKETVKRRQDKGKETIKQFNERRNLHHGIRHFQVPRKCHYHKEIVQPKIAITNCSRTTSRKQHPWTRPNVRHNYYHFGGKPVSNKQIENMKKRWPQINRRPYRFGPHHTVPVYKGVNDDIVIVVTEPEQIEHQTESVSISSTTPATESSPTEVIEVTVSSTTEIILPTPSSTPEDKSITTEVIESKTPSENDGAVGKGQVSTTEAISTSPSEPPTERTTVPTSSEEVEIVEVDTGDVDVGVLLTCLTKKEKAEEAAKKIDDPIVHNNATNPEKAATLDEVIPSEDANDDDKESSAEEEGYLVLIDIRTHFEN